MHAVAMGHPVMGDALYGTEEGKAKSKRLLLHAQQLSFVHVSVERTQNVPYAYACFSEISEYRSTNDIADIFCASVSRTRDS